MIRHTRRRGVAAIVAAWACGLALLVAAPIALPATVAPAPSASAVNASDWNAGNIIDDAVFYDANAMSAGEIQGFLNDKVRNCQSGYTCLKDYRQNTDNRPADKYCNGYSGAPNESAATIIDKVARSCGISQKSLLVLLQKEQGLVTSTAPSAWNYSAATGQGCPDTAPCDASTQGFFYQVYYGARQFEVYRLNPTWWGYQAGRWNNILYNPNGGCGTQRVYIENQATAGLYIYTPYVPNQAALNNLYGSGDGCSAYGNRNFWRTFTDWFGSTRAVSDAKPIGGYNIVTERGGFSLRGWAIDPDAPTTSLQVTVSVDGVDAKTFLADDDRPDVGTAYPAAGNRHGIRATIDTVGGDQTICVRVQNIGVSAFVDWGCQTVFIQTASPYGGVDITPLIGGIRVVGWTLDTDTSDSLDVHIYIDGVGQIRKADVSRPDVSQAFPGSGDRHGIDASLETSVGVHQVCAYGINVGRGFNKLLGCASVSVTRSASPAGRLDQVFAEPGGYRVRGWSYDPNSSSPINVHVYRNGQGMPFTTDVNRPDVVAAFSDAPLASGFDRHLDAPSGVSTVCAYGINVGWGANSSLGCQNVEVRSGNPFGGIDTTVDVDRVRLRGWAIDPDTSQPIAVHYYVDGRGVAIRADVDRPDVGNVYPGYGSTHGIDVSFSLDPGPHTVCAYGINVGSGQNSLLGCSDVVTETHSPFGGTNIDRVGSGVRVQGWAIDRDTDAPVVVHVYIDGVGVRIASADVDRPDIARAYPAAGSRRGIDLVVPVPPGARTLCVYGINVGPGANSSLGCHAL